MQEERKALCRRFSVTRGGGGRGARCKIHRITPTACSYYGDNEEGGEREGKEEREGRDFPLTYITSKLFHRPLTRPTDRPRPPDCSLRWLAGLPLPLGGRADIKAGELGTMAAAVALLERQLGIARERENDGKGKKQKVSLRNQ